MTTRWLGRLALALALAQAACGGSARSGAKATGGAFGAPKVAPSAGGEPGARSCVGLDCLAGAELTYEPTQTWHAPPGRFDAAGELAEADYTPMPGATIALKFSDDATQLQLTPTAGGATVTGTRNLARTDRAWYELQLFAGGRFVVQVGANQFTAEHTIYGSGRPILSSTRGVLKDLP